MAQTNPASLTNSAAAPPDIRPLKPPVDIPTGWEWLWWVAGAVVLAAAVLAVILHLRRRAQTAPPPVPEEPPHAVARRRLELAWQHLSDPKQFTVDVSDTLRWYLERRFHLRAPERTTEEFLSDLQKSLALPPSHKASLEEFLQECDLVKFARFEPTEEALRRLHAVALKIVEETGFGLVPPASPSQSTPTA